MLQVGARYRVALQLHPQEDFTANPPHGPLGPTAARWRALQARGWQVRGASRSWCCVGRKLVAEQSLQAAIAAEANVCAACCVQVVTLQQSKWRWLKTKQEQVEYAWQLGQGVEVSAPGMPHLVHQVLMEKDKAAAESQACS